MSNFWRKRKVLPTVTTISGSWRAKMKEVRDLNLKEVCLFPTCIGKKERKELISLLKKTKVCNIPLVHLRSDMSLEEMDFFIKNYNTKVFNTHSEEKFPLKKELLKHKDIIFIENVHAFLKRKELDNFAGLCLDLSHLENDRRINKERFDYISKLAKEYRIGCNHISALKDYSRIDDKGYERYDWHDLDDLSNMNYLKKYPLGYFSPIIAIELEDSISKQLEVRDYVIDLLKDKD